MLHATYARLKTDRTCDAQSRLGHGHVNENVGRGGRPSSVQGPFRHHASLDRLGNAPLLFTLLSPLLGAPLLLRFAECANIGVSDSGLGPRMVRPTGWVRLNLPFHFHNPC